MTPEPAALDLRSRDGGPLRVWDYGGGGPPLLFCHCAGTLGRVWEPVIRRLDPRWHVYALDFRGHGDSLKPEDRRAHQWASYAGDVEDAARQLSFGPGAAAVGHSGGGVAVALNLIHHPALFSRAALLDAILAPSWFFPEEMPLAHGARRRKLVFASAEEAAGRLGAKAPYIHWHPEARAAFLAHGLEPVAGGRVKLKCPGHLEAFFYECGSSEGTLHALEGVHVPVLCVAGGESYMLEHVREQHRRLPCGELVVIPGGTHFFPQEKPEETARALNNWFAATDDAQSASKSNT
ncbi:MAG TPA: alpha/beta hydrolase [Candidatus Hydrogenedentes bacterium]|nr:alpha/beta hydrolase [Candidatus Hydrogenedentota bacterium]